MATCRYCGEEIEFRRIDGVITPIHVNGGFCAGGMPESSGVENLVFEEKVCWRTRCPECQDKVFFIRHNGGCLWVNELGWPWAKHPCMDKDPVQARAGAEIISAISAHPKGVANVIVRVVIVPDKKECLVAVENMEGLRKVWMVFDASEPRRFVGALCVLYPKDGRMVCPGIGEFKVEEAPVSCRLCDEFMLESEMETHLATVHGLNRCPTCGALISKGAWQAHINRHAREKRLASRRRR